MLGEHGPRRAKPEFEPKAHALHSSCGIRVAHHLAVHRALTARFHEQHRHISRNDGTMGEKVENKHRADQAAPTVTRTAADVRGFWPSVARVLPPRSAATIRAHYRGHLMHAAAPRYVFLIAGCSQPWVMVYALGEIGHWVPWSREGSHH